LDRVGNAAVNPPKKCSQQKGQATQKYAPNTRVDYFDRFIEPFRRSYPLQRRFAEKAVFHPYPLLSRYCFLASAPVLTAEAADRSAVITVSFVGVVTAAGLGISATDTGVILVFTGAKNVPASEHSPPVHSVQFLRRQGLLLFCRLVSFR